MLPDPLRAVIKNEPYSLRNNKLEEELRKPQVLKAYLIWSQANTSLIENNQELGGLDLIARKITQENSKPEMEKVSAIITGQNVEFEMAKNQIVLLNAGLIKTEECFSHPVFKNLYDNPKLFASIVPLANELEPDQIAFLTNGKNLLESSTCFPLAFPLLKKLTPANLAAFFSVKTNEGHLLI